MFQSLPAPEPDGILQLSQGFRADSSVNKIDLRVGAYRDASGRSPVMAAVQEAEKRLHAEPESKA